MASDGNKERTDSEWIQREMDAAQARCRERELTLRDYIRDVDLKNQEAHKEMADAIQENALSLAKIAGIGMAAGAMGTVMVLLFNLVASGLRADFLKGAP